LAPENKWRRKTNEWLLRYAPAEAVAAAGVVLIAWLVFRWSHNRVMAALAGSATEMTAFYAVIWIRDRHDSKRRRAAKLILEFLPAGVFNACIVRPYLLYAVPLHVGNFGVGVLIAKVLADVCFYVLAIPMYELTKRTTTLPQA